MRVLCIAFAGLVSFGAASESRADPIEVPAPISQVFHPAGFDDNDNVEVIAQGVFPNSCYKVGKHSARVDHKNKIVSLLVTAFHYPVESCAQVVTPFIVPVKLGLLKEGRYQVKLAQQEEHISQFSVSPRKSESADDHTYAPVAWAELVESSEGEGLQVHLKGRYPIVTFGCARITNVRIKVKPADVVVVQPIMNFFEQDACDSSELDFDIRVPVKGDFAGKGLLHVRVLNGNSLNKYIDLPQS